ALSDAEIAAILERNDRDERGEVPDDLVSSDDLAREFHALKKDCLDHGLIPPDIDVFDPPDQRFLEQRYIGCRDREKLEDVYWRAVIELLRNCRRLRIPLSQLTLEMVASKLERLLWPDPKAEAAEDRRLHLAKAEMMRRDFE